MATFQEIMDKMVTSAGYIAAKQALEDMQAEEAARAEDEAELLAEAKAAGYPLCLADTMANATGGRWYHAHSHDERGSNYPALCGATPGKRGYWGHYFGEVVTCPKCKRRMAK